MGYKVKEYAIILLIVGFLAYLPSLFGNFVWDDEDFVYANTYVKEFRLDRFFTENAIAGRGKSSNYYRPVQFSLYALVYKAFGPAPWAFHLTGILLHLTAGMLIYLTFVHLLTPFPAFLASLLFLIHPVQTESVSYISGLSDQLYTAFFFASILVFLRRKRPGWSAMTFVSLVFFVLALLSKELGIILPGILLLLLFMRKKLDKKDIPVVAVYFVISLTYLILRFTVLKFMDIGTAWAGNPYGSHLTIRIATFFQDFFIFLSLLVFPATLFMERDYSTKLVPGLLSPWTFLFFLANGVIIFILYRKRHAENCRNALLFYVLFLSSLVPYTGLFLLNGVLYEHYLYLPIAFFSAAIISLIAPYLKRKPVLAVLTVIILLFLIRSYARQWEWIDNERFYRQTLSHAPKSIRMLNGLAMTLADKNNCGEAIVYYRKAIEINPDVPNMYHNMANCFVDLGRYEDAETYYLKALNINPAFQFSYSSLLQLYLQTNQKEKAKALLHDRIIPRYPDSQDAKDLYNRL